MPTSLPQGIRRVQSGAPSVVRRGPRQPRPPIVLGKSQAPRSQVPDVSGESRQILEAFYYGRAVAMTFSRRLGETVVEVVSEVTKAIAEQPQRWEEFQEEVEALAQQELAGARSLPGSSSSSSSSTGLASSRGATGSSSSAGSKNGAGSTPGDLEAVVDEMRADIASARALLQQMKAQAATTAS